MKYLNKVIAAFALCVMFISMACPMALAEPIDVEAPCGLTIDYSYEGEPIVGARFELYRVAELSADARLTMTGAFADLTVDMEDMTAAALALSQRAAGTQADCTLTTGEDGLAAVELSVGMYLMIGEPVTVGDRTHYMDPQLVILPMQLEDGGWNYELTLQPKSTHVDVEQELVEITAVKQWDDTGYEQERPGSVTVRLLRDGQTVSTVELSAENSWTHTWTELLPGADWTVEEDVPAGYVVSIEKDDGTFILTNHRRDIPQTGQIWWPVAAVFCLGLVMIAVGVITKRSGRHDA